MTETPEITDLYLREIFCNAMKNNLGENHLFRNTFQPKNFSCLQHAINDTLLNEIATIEDIRDFIPLELTRLNMELSTSLYITRAFRNALDYASQFHGVSLPSTPYKERQKLIEAKILEIAPYDPIFQNILRYSWLAMQASDGVCDDDSSHMA